MNRGGLSLEEKCVVMWERGVGKKNATYMSHICMKKENSAELKERGSLFVCLVGWLVCVWVCLWQQLFFSYFKELVGKVVTVELKNDLAITGILHSVDQYLNIKLEDTRVVDEAKYPHMVRTFSSTSRVFVVRPLLFFFFLFRLCFVIF